MQAPQFEARLLSPDTWVVEGFDVGANMYLLLGEREGLLIDNGYGEYDPRAFAESVCGRPVRWTAITHGHFDHAGGCMFFDRVFMLPEAEPEAKEPYPSLKGRSYDFGYPIEYLTDGDVIDLGGRRIEVFAIPSHSKGDAAFLDRQTRLLFAGDAAGRQVNLQWPQGEPQPTVERLRDNLRKLASVRMCYDRVCVGHAGEPVDAACIDAMLENAGRILEGIPVFAPKPLLDADGEPVGAPPGKGPRPEDVQQLDSADHAESEWKGTVIGYDRRYIWENGG